MDLLLGFSTYKLHSILKSRFIVKLRVDLYLGLLLKQPNRSALFNIDRF